MIQDFDKLWERTYDVNGYKVVIEGSIYNKGEYNTAHVSARVMLSYSLEEKETGQDHLTIATRENAGAALRALANLVEAKAEVVHWLSPKDPHSVMWRELCSLASAVKDLGWGPEVSNIDTWTGHSECVAEEE